MAPLAVLAALSLAVVSFACVVSCWGVEAAVPPCHHHKSSCGPLLLTGEAPWVFAAAAPAAHAISFAAAPTPSVHADVSDSFDRVPAFLPPRSPLQPAAVLRI